MPDSKSECNANCPTLAFYGLSNSDESGTDFYRLLQDWFEAMGVRASHIGVNAPGFSRRIITFKRGHPRLQRTSFSDVNSFEVTAALPNTDWPTINYFVTAGWMPRRPAYISRDVVYVSVRENLCSLHDKPFRNLARECIQCHTPIYGMGYQMQCRFRPELYTVGLIGQTWEGETAFFDYEEELNISHWGGMGFRLEIYRRGVLRDVYPLNYLSEVHLQRRVGESTLADWIRALPERGTLSPMPAGMTCWEVSEDRIPAIRKVLWDAKAIFHWRDYLEEAEEVRLKWVEARKEREKHTPRKKR